jgi:hypothetical protein
MTVQPKTRRAIPTTPDLMSIKVEKKRAKQPGTARQRKSPGPGHPKLGNAGRPKGVVSYQVYARLAYEGIARAIARIGKSDDMAVGLEQIFQKGDNAIKLKILDIFCVLAEKRTPAMLSDEELSALGQADNSGQGQGVHIHLHGMPGVQAPELPDDRRSLPAPADLIDVLPIEKEEDVVDVAYNSKEGGEGTNDD